jgi:hypothetical protein
VGCVWLLMGGRGGAPPQPQSSQVPPWRRAANPLVRGFHVVNRDLPVRPDHIISHTSLLLWGVLCRQVRPSAPSEEGVGWFLLPENPGNGGSAGPGGGPGVGVGVSPRPQPRSGSRDRPLPGPVDPLVEARSRTCPTCNLRIGSIPVLLIFQCCMAQYHKQARCSGLTPGALDI